MPPTEDERDDLLLSCRFGDLADVEAYCSTYPDDLDVRDAHGNTVLHMVAANGHTDLLRFLLARVDPECVGRPNDAGSTPLHWAAVNRELETARVLVEHPAGPGVDLIDIKNKAGRTALGEAEMGGWDEGANWFVEVMKLDAKVKEDEDR